MITYLASYPRSGNTMLRYILQDVFGTQTYSKYAEGNKKSSLAENEEEWREARPRCVAATEHYFVKTHDHPEGDQPAIVIVRDPRAVIVSYWHYFNKIELDNVSLEAVANGLCHYGEWAAFYAAWQPQNRANTLLLRYEDLLVDPDRCIDKIAGFTSLTPVGKWSNNFSEMNALDPDFFRAGNNQANISEISTQQEEYILSRFGPMMAKLGYQTAPLSVG